MHIADSIHGYIELDEEEQEIIDSPEMQRLRRIRQLGLSSLVYPSATHTRFQHSLGVMHLAGKFAKSVGLREEQRKELRIAGLLHDSGHGPFSHASEVVAEKEGLSHEDLSCQIASKIEDLYSVDSRRVEKIIRGELEIGQIVAGDIDADRMDYLVRDSHYSGMEHGKIDTDTIIRLAEMDRKRLVFSHKAIPVLESLFTSRFHMIKTLYNHHAVRIAEKILERSLENYLEQGNSLGHLMKMDDYEAHNKLKDSNGVAGELYQNITERKLFKRALIWDEDKIPRKGLKSLENRLREPRKIEAEIAEEAGIPEHKVIIDPPRTPGIKDIEVKVKKNSEIKKLEELSPIPETLNDAEWRTVAMKVYCPCKHREKVKKTSREILENYTKVLSSYV